MSDLLPLLVATLRDKVVVDAQEEIKALREEAKEAQLVEIIHGFDNEGEGEYEDLEPVIYAAGNVQDGKYGNNSRFWEVQFETKQTCLLKHLRSCRICVGGGFEIESLDSQQINRAAYECILDDYEEDSDNCKVIQFCFCPNSMWFTIGVRGWPRSDWDGWDIDPQEGIDALVDDVAVRYPEATVEFREISLPRKSNHLAIRRLVSAAKITEARFLRDTGVDEDTLSLIAQKMREYGNSDLEPTSENVREFYLLVRTHTGFDILEVLTEEPILGKLVKLYVKKGPEVFESKLRELAQIMAAANDEEMQEGED